MNDLREGLCPSTGSVTATTIKSQSSSSLGLHSFMLVCVLTLGVCTGPEHPDRVLVLARAARNSKEIVLSLTICDLAKWVSLDMRYAIVFLVWLSGVTSSDAGTLTPKLRLAQESREQCVDRCDSAYDACIRRCPLRTGSCIPDCKAQLSGCTNRCAGR
jgi:hypothetical protein